MEDGKKVHGSTRTIEEPAIPSGQSMVGREVAEAFRDYLASCAAQYSRSYDDREELISRVVIALLEYAKPIQHPRKFIRVTAKNLALNSARVGCGLWETVESEIADLQEVEKMARTSLHEPLDESSTENVVVLKDTLLRLEGMLSPAERRCYQLLKEGLEQRDLARLLGISRQGVYKILRSIRKKYELADEAS